MRGGISPDTQNGLYLWWSVVHGIWCNLL